jgi:hypothetical protein
MNEQAKDGDRMTSRQPSSSQTTRSGTRNLLLRNSHSLKRDGPLKTGTLRSETMIQAPTGVETTENRGNRYMDGGHGRGGSGNGDGGKRNWDRR